MCKTKKIISIVCAAAMLAGLITFNPASADAAKAPKLNKKKISVNIGDTYKIKIKNGAKKAKVTWKSNKKRLSGLQKNQLRAKKLMLKLKR